MFLVSWDVLLEIALSGKNRKSMSWMVVDNDLRISFRMLVGPNVFPLAIF